MKIAGNEIKTGMIIEHKGDYWNVLKTQHVKPGKGGAFNQVELKSLLKGTKLNERFRSSETVEKAQLDEKKFKFLYNDENDCHFMDSINFEQISLPKRILEEKYKLLSENIEVIITFMEEKPLSVELPKNLKCIIKETEAVVSGQTAASSYKPAILNNDLKISVPPFIKEGDEIILDTRTLEYIKKAN